jgi:hypothetical protein
MPTHPGEGRAADPSSQRNYDAPPLFQTTRPGEPPRSPPELCGDVLAIPERLKVVWLTPTVLEENEVFDLKPQRGRERPEGEQVPEIERNALAPSAAAVRGDRRSGAARCRSRAMTASARSNVTHAPNRTVRNAVGWGDPSYTQSARSASATYSIFVTRTLWRSHENMRTVSHARPMRGRDAGCVSDARKTAISDSAIALSSARWM